MAERPTLLVIGAAARDIDPTDPRGWRLGGTVAYASLAAARLGVHVRALVGVDDQAATAHELEILRTAGVDLRMVPIDRGPVFDNRQTPSGRFQVAHQSSDRMRAPSLPDEWRSSRTVLLGPVANELGPEWAAAFGRKPFLALAWQGLLRDLTPGQPVSPLSLTRSALVERADLLLVSAEDVGDNGALIGEILADGQRLIVTNGAHGVVELCLTDGRIKGRYAPALPPAEVVDETGAGDVFIAAWLATRILTGADDGRLSQVASVMAGLSVGRRGFGDMPSRRDLCDALLRRRGRRGG